MNTLTIMVGPDEITAGIPASIDECPVALAIDAALDIDSANVSDTKAEFPYPTADGGSRMLSLDLPDEVQRWIQCFDCGDDMTPIDFILTIPE